MEGKNNGLTDPKRPIWTHNKQLEAIPAAPDVPDVSFVLIWRWKWALKVDVPLSCFWEGNWGSH